MTKLAKVLRLLRKLQLILWKRHKSIAPATQNDFRHVIKQVGMSQSAAPAKQNDMTTCLETFDKERFCSFPHRHGDATRKPKRIETRHVGGSKRAFRARLPQFVTLRIFKIDVFLRVFSWTWKFATSSSMFCGRIDSVNFQLHLTKCHACHGICTLSPLDAALTMRFAKSTQHATSKVLRLPRKMTMGASKVLRLPRKLQRIFWKRRQSIAPATQNDFRQVTKHVWMSRSATPATQNAATRRWKHQNLP